MHSARGKEAGATARGKGGEPRQRSVSASATMRTAEKTRMARREWQATRKGDNSGATRKMVAHTEGRATWRTGRQGRGHKGHGIRADEAQGAARQQWRQCGCREVWDNLSPSAGVPSHVRHSGRL